VRDTVQQSRKPRVTAAEATTCRPDGNLRAALEPPAGGRARVVLEDAGVYGIVVLRPGGAAR
jgi:hypothetical protein